MQIQAAKPGNEFKIVRIAETEFDLHKAGFGWITNNDGVHLQITIGKDIIADYWPTTEKLKFRKCSNSARIALIDVVKHQYQKAKK